MSIDRDPDYWKFSNEDGKLERCDMRQFKRDLDAAIEYSKQLRETDPHFAEVADEVKRQLIDGLPPSGGLPDCRPHRPRYTPTDDKEADNDQATTAHDVA